jgi:hypothetical protein
MANRATGKIGAANQREALEGTEASSTPLGHSLSGSRISGTLAIV